MSQDYLRWLAANTRTAWWNDSIEPGELSRGRRHGAVGATSNPFLAHAALTCHREAWSKQIASVLAEKLDPEVQAEALMRIAVVHAAEALFSEYDRSDHKMGYVCAQVNPARAGQRDVMRAMARRFTQWAPNIAVKLPVTAAGLDVLEDCAAEGITCALTISYTVAQVVAVAERYRRGLERARAQGLEPGRCFTVIMIGRLDDYLRDVVHDTQIEVSEADIRQAGVAVTKRTVALCQERRYETNLIVAALRGTYHMTELAGADVIISIAVPYQDMLMKPDVAQEERIDVPVPDEVIERLSRMPEFLRAYEPDGMRPEEFITYGVVQKTLAQFHESGWKLLEGFK
jgi:transaldolase